MKNKLLLLIFLFTLKAASQSGTLDPTFGNGGKVYTGFGPGNSTANAVAVQPDGKIIVGGSALTANTVNTWEKDANNFTLARYNTDGSLDSTFGYDGKVMTDMYTFYTNNTNSGYIYALKLQADGKIIAYGVVGSQNVLMRYNNDGSIDTGFGLNGLVRSDSGPTLSGLGNTLEIQPDGKIVVLGLQWSQPAANTYTTQFVVERYNADGSDDITFATDGRVVTAFGSGYDMPQAMTLQPDGKILVAGTSTSFNTQFVVVRYTSNGVLDTTFDGDGKVSTSFGTGTYSSPNFITAHADGKILVAGTTGSATGIAVNFMVVKYNTNGSLDTTFDGDGKAVNPFEATDASYNIMSALEQPDGKFLITTSADLYGGNNLPNDFVARKYNANATTDVSFGVNGKVTTTFLEGFNQPRNSALQPDGKILIVGYSHDLSYLQNDSNMVRYQSNGTLDTTFGTGGKVTMGFDSTNDESNILLIQPDGKLLAIGTKRNHTDNGYLFQDIALSRYNTDGSLDTGFGTQGKVVSIFVQNNINRINCAALQPDGKIILANAYYNLYIADTSYHYELIRYTAGGIVDTTFGTGGKVIIDAQPDAILIQADGKIITTGTGADAQNNAALVVKRYHSNGMADSSFGNNGMASIAGTFYGTGKPVLQPDGKIVVSASAQDISGPIGFIAMRFNANGVVDSGFASNITIVNNGCLANTTFVQPDGKVIIAGKSFGSGFNEFVTARYNTNGSLDTAYGIDGFVRSYLGVQYQMYTEIQSVVRQPDGKFLVALSRLEPYPATPHPDTYDFVIYRFDTQGNYDNDFGANGQIATGFYNKYDEAFAMLLQSDNKIVVAGTTDTGINRDFALVRYENTVDLGNPDFDTNTNTNLILYPNPTAGSINIQFPDRMDVAITSVSIYNVLGQTVFSESKGSNKIDVGNLQPGIYVLKATTATAGRSAKFIKE
jgi:uncharacterized delta-60 repeat protein